MSSTKQWKRKTYGELLGGLWTWSLESNTNPKGTMFWEKREKRKQQKNKKNTHLSNLWCAVVVVSNVRKGRFLESIIWSLAFLSRSFCHQNSDPSKHYPIKMAFGQITSHIWCFGRSSLRTNWSPKTQQLLEYQENNKTPSMLPKKIADKDV